MNKFKHKAVALGIAMAISGTAYAELSDNEVLFDNDFSVTCTSTGQLCEPLFSASVTTDGDRLKAQYVVPGHCSSVRVHVYIDGNLVQTTRWLGWDKATGSFASLPLDSGMLDLGPVSSGVHHVSLQAEGQKGGCNGGSLGIWGGRLKIVSSNNKTYEDGLKEGIAKCQNDPASCGITVPPESGNCPRVDTHASFSPSDGVLTIPAVDVPDIFGGVRTYRAEMSLNPGEGLVFSVTTAEPIQ
jgi:hypothetical protein